MTKMRPEPGDYAPYAEKYISLISGTDIVDTLKSQFKQTVTLFSGRSERDGNFRYAADKWTVKEVVGHIADAERIFAHRALHIARGDQSPLAGFDQESYVRNARFNERHLADIVQEYADVRQASLALFGSFTDEAWLRRGVVNNNPTTVQAIAFMIAGHEIH